MDSDEKQKRRSLVWPFLLTSGIALGASFYFSDGRVLREAAAKLIAQGATPLP